MSDRKATAERSLDQLSPNERSLFDCGVRTRKEARGSGESQFSFLNRVAWESVTEARQNLESWFSKVPNKKRSDIRKRFRGDDRQHHGALFELVTHEVLSAVGTDVVREPPFNGKSPDFSFECKNERILVECEVVQEPDSHFKMTQKRYIIERMINTIESGPFLLFWKIHRAGTKSPPLGGFRRDLERHLSSLDPSEVARQFKQDNYNFGSFFWCHDGWVVRVDPCPGLPQHERGSSSGTIHSQIQSGIADDHISLRKGLEGKANKYRPLETPFVVFTGSNKWPTHPHAILHGLFGSRALRFSRGEIRLDETWPYSDRENFLGSPAKPRNCHVSAVLHKSFAHHTSIWGLCHSDASWVLIHNPWATRPLQSGMFPFAFEWTLEHLKFVQQEPSCTLNKLLGLSDPWPGNGH